MATRRDYSDRLCERLSRRVAEISPPGLGAWSPSWEIVARPSAEFMTAVVAWEADGGCRALARLQRGYHDVIGAWKRASAEFLDRSGVEPCPVQQTTPLPEAALFAEAVLDAAARLGFRAEEVLPRHAEALLGLLKAFRSALGDAPEPGALTDEARLTGLVLLGTVAIQRQGAIR